MDNKVEIIKNLSFGDYLAIDAINHSTLAKYHQGAFQAKYAMDNPSEKSKSQEIGDFVHDSILYGIGYVNKHYMLYDDFNKNKERKRWNELKKQAEEQNKVLADRQYLQCYTNVMANEDCKHLLKTDKREYTIVWEVEGVKYKCRVDAMNEQMGVMIDLKTTKSVNWRDMQSSLFNYNYWTQMAFYKWACKIANIDVEDVVIIFIQNEAPFEVAPVRVDDDLIAMGSKQIDIWIKQHLECVKNNKWESWYSEDLRTMTVPEWAITAIENRLQE